MPQEKKQQLEMAFWVLLFSCGVITASARPLESLNSDETRKLISKWNLDHAFGKVSPRVDFDAVDRDANLQYKCSYLCVKYN